MIRQGACRLQWVLAAALLCGAHGEITSLRPLRGSLAGGTTLTIEGTGLVQADTALCARARTPTP